MNRYCVTLYTTHETSRLLPAFSLLAAPQDDDRFILRPAGVHPRPPLSCHSRPVVSIVGCVHSACIPASLTCNRDRSRREVAVSASCQAHASDVPTYASTRRTPPQNYRGGGSSSETARARGEPWRQYHFCTRQKAHVFLPPYPGGPPRKHPPESDLQRNAACSLLLLPVQYAHRSPLVHHIRHLRSPLALTSRALYEPSRVHKAVIRWRTALGRNKGI